jgi:hypothetical protein
MRVIRKMRHTTPVFRFEGRSAIPLVPQCAHSWRGAGEALACRTGALLLRVQIDKAFPGRPQWPLKIKRNASNLFCHYCYYWSVRGAL